MRPNSNERYDDRQSIKQTDLNKFGLIDDRSEQWMAMNWKKHMLTKFSKSKRQIVQKMLNSNIDFFPTPN